MTRTAEILALECTTLARERLDELLADDFVEFGASGRTYDRDAAIAGVAADERTFELHDYDVTELAHDVVLATYGLIERDGEATRASLRSSVWVRRDGAWRLRFHQGTPVG